MASDYYQVKTGRLKHQGVRHDLMLVNFLKMYICNLVKRGEWSWGERSILFYVSAFSGI